MQAYEKTTQFLETYEFQNLVAYWRFLKHYIALQKEWIKEL